LWVRLRQSGSGRWGWWGWQLVARTRGRGWTDVGMIDLRVEWGQAGLCRAGKQLVG